MKLVTQRLARLKGGFQNVGRMEENGGKIGWRNLADALASGASGL